MAKARAKGSSDASCGIRPGLTPEARENQMIALAVNLAEQQLRDGTASSQVITHYLKLGTTKYKYETEKLAADTALQKVKAEAIEAQKRSEAKFEEAIRAMRVYQGNGDPEDYEDY